MTITTDAQGRTASVHDYVIVGAGSAGSVLARRLVDAGHSVHVLEAGAVDDDPSIHSPQGWPAMLQSAGDWAYLTVPQRHAAGRQLYWPRGKVLGGSSSINGMIYIRGHRADYDDWAKAGNDGWAWDDVLPLFLRSEDHVDGASRWHGAGGPLHVDRIRAPHPAAAAFVEAAVAAGHPATDDFNAERMVGAGANHTTTRDGRRLSAWRAFVAPVHDSALLTVTTGALVTRVVVEGGEAVGVEYTVGGETRRADAAAEVVLAGGTIGSAQVLLLSGIGPASHLRDVGVDIVHDLPGVGENLHDHLLVSLLYESATPLAPGTNNLLETQLFSHSSVSDSEAPDLQPLFLHLPYPTDGGPVPEHGYTIAPGLVRPRSRGTLRLASADPAAAPLLDPSILSEDHDVEALVDSIVDCLAIGEQAALAPHHGTGFRLPDASDRDRLRDYARRLAGTYHHQVGTCRMGVDDLAVVDPSLRVHGVGRLRVADASIMPQVPSGNTNAPTIMVGEKASDLLLGA